MKMNKKGFTLIELMIVVAIIGILAAIAIPKFADLINKSKEGATKGALSTVRSALQIYYGDNEGWFPTAPTSDAAGGAACMAVLTASSKYIAEVPLAKMPGTTHSDSTVVTAAAAADGGGWHYDGNASSPSVWGNFAVNCTHLDIKGRSSTPVATAGWSTF
ncbi:MAG: hypothetical protein A2270_02500 [Elusimicrobia bacterium RIFOXYA12_FULL_51_18]|nr:MAG: hypothetical protein A2270_02500 [Elusimicrobia bacterium RIFOXYA12_FULL_51_18]OGS31284.1 MAG: hypothetical protein A2218_08085 [Elusimicrobia bacterium RIFOXYA2_FULL_53_38]